MKLQKQQTDRQTDVFLSVRKAGLHDADQLSDLITKNVRHFHGAHYTVKEIKIWQDGYSKIAMEQQILNREVFVFENDKAMCGTIQWGNPEIKGCYIHPHFKGLGLGNLLLNFMVSYLKSTSHKRIELTSNEWTVGFYKKHGFKVLGLEAVYWSGHRFEEYRMARAI